MKIILGIAVVLSLVGAFTVLAQEVKPGKAEVIDLGKDVKLKMVLIPAGKFLMGGKKIPVDPFSNIKVAQPEEDEYPRHEVTLTKPYFMGKYEVTQEQWFEIMGENPSREKGRKLPITDVSWDDCHEFIKKLNAKTNGGYRLPTEAEWEYACRAGTTTAYSVGDSLPKSDGNVNSSSIKTVGSYRPNAFGLYDMHGNVGEWCEDWYDDYPAGAVTDPKGPVTGEHCVLRGGSYNLLDSRARSSNRDDSTPSDRFSYKGFRLASGGRVASGARAEDFLRLESTIRPNFTNYRVSSTLSPQITNDGKFAIASISGIFRETQGQMELLDLAAGKSVCSFSQSGMTFTSMAISPDSQDLAVSVWQRKIYVKDPPDHAAMLILDPHTLVEKRRFKLDVLEHKAVDMQWSSDGTKLVYVSNGHFYCIDAQTSKKLVAYKCGEISGWSLSRNATKVAFCKRTGENDKGQIVILDMETAEITAIDVKATLTSILFIDDTTLLTGEVDHECKVRKWELKDGTVKEGLHIKIANFRSDVRDLRYDPVNDTICVHDDHNHTLQFYSYAKFGDPKCHLSFKGKYDFKYTLFGAQNKLYAFCRNGENTLSLDSYVFERGTEGLSGKVTSKDYDNIASLIAFGDLIHQPFFDSFAAAGNKYWIKESSAGNPKGQFLQACCLLNGFNGITQEKRALELLRLSADQGDYLSLILLASRSKDKPDEAFANYKKAAETENHLVLEYLADCHRQGLGTAKDTEKAFQLSLKSAGAKNGLPYSMYSVGLAYFDGVGTAKSFDDAFKWFSKSADAGFADAHNNVGLCYLEGLGVGSDAVMAFKSFKKGHHFYSLTCALSLAQCYECGIGCDPDLLKAFGIYAYLVDNKKIASAKPKKEALYKKIQMDPRFRSLSILYGVSPYKNVSRRSTTNLKSHAIYEAQMAAWEAQRDHRNHTAGSLGAIGLIQLSIAPPPTRPIDYDR